VLFLHAGSLQRVQAHDHPNIGRLLQPRDFSRLADTLAAGYSTAVDNDGYKGVDFPKFSKMLASIRDTLWGELPTAAQLLQHAGFTWPAANESGEANPLGPPHPMLGPAPANFLWVVVPDVVADARETYRYFQWLHPAMCDLPLAYAVQDGSGDVGIPWDAPNLRCLFLAGSDEYKLSSEMAEIAAAGKARGLWIHGARCNSAKRTRHFASISCDSFDGTGASTWPRLLPEYLEWASAPPPAQQRLFL
jgi:hypothetical protein